jgi:hypothetical protein
MLVLKAQHLTDQAEVAAAALVVTAQAQQDLATAHTHKLRWDTGTIRTIGGTKVLPTGTTLSTIVIRLI